MGVNPSMAKPYWVMHKSAPLGLRIREAELLN